MLANFILKFQATDQKTAKKLGDSFCRTCVLHKQQLGISRHLYLY